MTIADTLRAAADHLKCSRPADAMDCLLPASQQYPDIADIWQLLALAYKGLGELAAAETAFLKALSLEVHASTLANLGNLYREMGRPDEALERYEEALAVDEQHSPAALGRAATLMALGKLDAAEAGYAQLLEEGSDQVTAPSEQIDALNGLGEVLQQQGRQEQALGLFGATLERDASNVRALTGQGLSLGALGYDEEAVEALSGAARQAADAAPVLAHLASALARSGREDEGIAAYREALSIEPENAEIHDWLNAYLGVLAHPDYLQSYRQALIDNPENDALLEGYAEKLLRSDRGIAARTLLEDGIASKGPSAARLVLLSRVCRETGEFDESLVVARRAVELAPDTPSSGKELALSIMAGAHDYSESVALLEALLSLDPDDQEILALHSTALRYAGEGRRYEVYADYDALVHQRCIEAPEGFHSTDTFLEALCTRVAALHTPRRHPVEQSAVNGTQTLDDLFRRRDPLIAALQIALRDQLVSVLNALPRDPHHPTLRRNTGGLVFSDSWSIRLHREGYHRNHFHPAGWLSSAFYLRVPEAVKGGTGEGWIKFGEPGFRAREPLPAEYWIQPEAGTLVVFPSYLWHGTEPLATSSERMTVGYDLLPGDAP